MRANHVVTACTLAGALLAGCSSETSTAPTEPTTPQESAGGVVTSSSELVPEGMTVTMPAGWRDTSAPTFRHFLPPEVSSDPLAERWGDILIYEATGVVDPTSGRLQPRPDDLAAWLRANPSVDVLDERAIEVDDRSAQVIDAVWQKDGAAFYGGETFESEAGTHERFIFVPVGQRWVVVQASTFRGADGLAEPDGGQDALVGVLESIDVTEP